MNRSHLEPLLHPIHQLNMLNAVQLPSEMPQMDQQTWARFKTGQEDSNMTLTILTANLPPEAKPKLVTQKRLPVDQLQGTLTNTWCGKTAKTSKNNTLVHGLQAEMVLVFHSVVLKRPNTTSCRSRKHKIIPGHSNYDKH